MRPQREAVDGPDPGAAHVLLVLNDVARADRVLNEFANLGISCEAAWSMGEAIGVLSRARFDVVVLDPDADDVSILDMTRWIRRHAPTLSVVVLGEVDDPQSSGAVRNLASALQFGGPDADGLVREVYRVIAAKGRGAPGPGLHGRLERGR